MHRCIFIIRERLLLGVDDMDWFSSSIQDVDQFSYSICATSKFAGQLVFVERYTMWIDSLVRWSLLSTPGGVVGFWVSWFTLMVYSGRTRKVKEKWSFLGQIGGGVVCPGRTMERCAGRKRTSGWTKAHWDGPNHGNVSSFIIRYR
jgi:hypothetical protein